MRSDKSIVGRSALVSLVFLLFAGCGGVKSGLGFALPDGDIERGKTAFLALRCHSCHTVSGVELPAIDNNDELIVALGGKTTRIQTYGELVTSIINPSHKVAKRYVEEQTADSEDVKSKMVNNNDAMTVSQLIDVVKFLQSHYELEPINPYPYGLH
jgi:sulfur-oxidizing protein SoxX